MALINYPKPYAGLVQVGIEATRRFPLLNPKSPYVLAAQSRTKDAVHKYGSIEDIRSFFLRTRGLRAGIPTPVAQAFLMGIRTGVKITFPLASYASMWLLEHLGLLHRIPPLPGRRKTTFRTSRAGLELLEYWCSTDKGFKAFFDVYVKPKDIERCMAWAATVAMGMDIELVTDAKATAKVLQDKIDADKQAQQVAYQAQMYSTSQVLQSYQNQLQQPQGYQNQLQQLQNQLYRGKKTP